MAKPKKSLGQHWLHDKVTLEYIAGAADLNSRDIVLEIGPGLGTLTSQLLKRASRVVAVEFDENLAENLPEQFPGKNLEVFSGDILSFDLNRMPHGYKVVANIPYYITNKIIQLLLTTKNKPSLAVLLIQKEVAERIAAGPGKMSILSISAQVFAEVQLGELVPSKMFTPPPKVDSRVIILKTRDVPYLGDVSQADFFRVVKAGFSSKRKKLKTSLSGGLGIGKDKCVEYLSQAQIDPDKRAEDLSIDDWIRLTELVTK
jgi:16S rRNA (adenine1518-N6/adenine1519-N6)-dimethyltransferase